MNIYTFQKLVLLGLFVVFENISFAKDTVLSAGQGVKFYQVDFPAENNTEIGIFNINLLKVRQVTGKSFGYINASLGNEWVIRNLPVFPENQYPYAQLSTQFNLNSPAGQDVSSLNASVVFSETVQQNFNPQTPTTFTVMPQNISIGGRGETTGSSGSVRSSHVTFTDVLFAKPSKSKAIIELDHPNIEAANNQCYPASIANSLQFLEDTTGLKVPHNNVAGLKGDNSLVGQLDTFMQRGVTNRRNGKPVADTIGLRGKLQYLAANNLHDKISTRHWGRVIASGTVKGSSGGRTARSSFQNAKLSFDDLFKAMQNGEDCELAYSTPSGGHAIDLVAIGETNGEKWLMHSSDQIQSSDTKGAGLSGFQFEYLNDPDGDGYFNLSGTNRKLDLAICQKYVKPIPTLFETTQSNLDLTVISIDDPASHLEWLTPPPNRLKIEFNGSRDNAVTFSSTTPPPWFPMEGKLETNSGAFSSSSIATVAGQDNIFNTFNGVVNNGELKGDITLGANGGLFGVPIIFHVSATGLADPFPVPNLKPITPKLRINGFRHNIQINRVDLTSVSIGLDTPNNLVADWWMIIKTPFLAPNDFLHFDLPSRSWKPGIKPSYQGKLSVFSFFPIDVIPENTLTTGDYTFYFGVDTVADGLLKMDDTLHFDFVNVLVK